MKAKHSKQLGKLLAFASAIVGLVAVVMIFLPQIVAASENSDTAYNGIAIAFGKELGSVNLWIAKGTGKIDFSFVHLLAYILVVFGLLVIVRQLAGVGKSKLFTFIAAVALIAGGIIFFLALNTTTMTISTSSIIGGGSTTSKFAELNSDSNTVYKLGYGAITGGVTAICSGVLALGKAVLSK